ARGPTRNAPVIQSLISGLDATFVFLGEVRNFANGWTASWSVRTGRVIKEKTMTKSVRYQDGCLYADHAAWYVKYRVQVRQEDGSIKLRQRAKMLGRLKDYPRESHIMPLKLEFMQRQNAGKFTPESSMNLREFVENIYLPYTDELRASTKKGYREIWNNHICDRVGQIRLREFRTVDASRMLKAIAEEHDLSKATLQHIKSVLSAVFSHAKNEGAFDGVNPVQDARIPRNAREARETFAYSL